MHTLLILFLGFSLCFLLYVLHSLFIHFRSSLNNSSGIVRSVV